MKIECVEPICWPLEQARPAYVQVEPESGRLFCRKGSLPKCIDSSPFVPFPLLRSVTHFSHARRQEHVNSVYTHPTFPRLIATPPLLLLLSALPDREAGLALQQQIEFLEEEGSTSERDRAKLMELKAEQLATAARSKLAQGGKMWRPYVSTTQLLLTYSDVWMTLLGTGAPRGREISLWARMQSELRESCRIKLEGMKQELERALAKLQAVAEFVEAGGHVERVRRLTREEAEAVLDDASLQELRRLDLLWQRTYIKILESHILSHLEVPERAWPLFQCRFQLLPLSEPACYAYLNELHSFLEGVCKHKNAIVAGSFAEDDIPDFREEAARLQYPDDVSYVRLLCFLYLAPDSCGE